MCSRQTSSFELRLKASMARPVALPTSSSTIPAHPSESMKMRGVVTVEKSFNMGAIEELNAIIAKMFYSGGLPLTS